MYNYNGRVFKSVQHSENAETVEGSIFEYHQEGNIVTCSYKSRNIKQGHLMAIVHSDGGLDMRYHQVNSKGQLMTGHCQSTPELLANDKIRLHEKWKWTSGDLSEGHSILEEQ